MIKKKIKTNNIKLKIISAFMAVLMLVPFAAFSTFAALKYDVDGNGAVSISDVTLIQKYLIGTATLTSEQLKIADCNGDGRVSINDATFIQKYLLEMSEDSDETDTYILSSRAQETDKNYSGQKYKLSSTEKAFIEKIVTGEFGSSYEGSVCIAQCIRDALVYGFCNDPMNLMKSSSKGGMGYIGYNENVTQNAKNAVEFVFDEGGSAVKHRMLVMCTKSYSDAHPGNWHSTQNFILQYSNVLFYDYWI